MSSEQSHSSAMFRSPRQERADKRQAGHRGSRRTDRPRGRFGQSNFDPVGPAFGPEPYGPEESGSANYRRRLRGPEQSSGPEQSYDPEQPFGAGPFGQAPYRPDKFGREPYGPPRGEFGGREGDPSWRRARRGPRGRGGHPGRRGSRRGAKGDIRAAVLLVLAEQPMHGYQIIQSLNQRSGGVWRPSPGSVYPTLNQLSDEGLLELRSQHGRNVAQLTDAGTQYVEQHRTELGSPWDDVAGSVKTEAHDVSSEVDALLGAVQQVLRVGNPAQVSQAGDTLAAARRALYRLLAEEPDAAASDRSTTDHDPASDR